MATYNRLVVAVAVALLGLFACSEASDPGFGRHSSLSDALRQPEKTITLSVDAWSFYSSGLDYAQDNVLSEWPERVAELTALRLLALPYHELNRLPDDLPQLNELTDLDLTGNKIAILPDSVARLTALRYLRLGGNRLETLPESLAELRDLRYIDVTGNPLTDAALAALRDRLPSSCLIITNDETVLFRMALQDLTSAFVAERGIASGQAWRLWPRLEHDDYEWLLLAVVSDDEPDASMNWRVFRQHQDGYRAHGDVAIGVGDVMAVAQSDGLRVLRLFDADAGKLTELQLSDTGVAVEESTLSKQNEPDRYARLFTSATVPSVERWPVERLLD